MRLVGRRIILALLLLSKSEPLVRGAIPGQRFFVGVISCRLHIAGRCAQWPKALSGPFIERFTWVERHTACEICGWAIRF